MKASRDKDQTRRTFHFWHAHVKAMKHSGLSRAEYCRQHELSYHAMTYWSRKIQRPNRTPNSTLVPVPMHQVQQLTVARQPLRLHLAGQRYIEINEHFSEHTLKRLLALLEKV